MNSDTTLVPRRFSSGDVVRLRSQRWVKLLSLSAPGSDIWEALTLSGATILVDPTNIPLQTDSKTMEEIHANGPNMRSNHEAWRQAELLHQRLYRGCGGCGA